jgi:uncharacterized protein YecE (DUF72 family)
MKVRIGTSGWHYKHWLGRFYPERFSPTKMLAWYAERFDTVEINNSFYRLPPETALASWRETVPAGFCFAVKGSRFITHMKKLKDPEAALDKFLPRAELLGRKLGPILFQLPPYWPPDLPRFEHFLNALPRRHRYGFEFRNQEWHTDSIYRLLEKHGAAFCTFDLAGFTSPERITADFAYVRLHGPGGKYQGSYSNRQLEKWASRVRSWPVKSAYIYFDNDDSAFAAKNALELREILSESAYDKTWNHASRMHSPNAA